MEKLGIRSATDLQEFIPQQAGGTVNLNIGNGGDGRPVQLARSFAQGNFGPNRWKTRRLRFIGHPGVSAGPDINLIPFSMVDHVDILKDGASAVYGSDAIAGVVNFFLVHKYRGLEIGVTYGNTNMGAPTKWASGKHGSKPAPEMTKPISWSLPISGSALVAFSVVTAIFRPMGISCSSGETMCAAAMSLAAWGGFRLGP